MIGAETLEVGKWAEAYVRFLSPELYPHSVWVGREIEFKEGLNVTGKVIVTEVYNDILLK